MKRLLVIAVCLYAGLPALAVDEARRPMALDDMFRFLRVGDPQISPDGKRVAYTVGTVDLEKNQVLHHLWIAAVDSTTQPRQLTAAAKSDRHPRWSPDGKTILFESSRSGPSQLWTIAVDGGEARQLTSLGTGASEGIWSRDGKRIAFVSAVWPEYSTKPFAQSDALNKKRAEEIDKNPVKAKVFTRLFFRHWDEYVEDKRQHLFVLDVSDKGDGLAAAGPPRDVTPGDRDAHPTSSTFSSGADFTFSPDGTHLLLTAAPEKNEAWSTNYDICRVKIENTSTKWENLTKDNKAADGGPQFSPDGKRLAYRAQKRAGFEADRWEIMVVETSADGAWTGPPRNITAKWDYSPETFVWSPSGGWIVCQADQAGRVPIFEIATDAAESAEPRISQLVGTGMNGSLSISRTGLLAYLQGALDHPPEIHLRSNTQEKEWVVFAHNKTLLDQLDRPRPESVTVPGADGVAMQMWILKPPGFDAKKKWPLVYLVHGGPQGAWEDGWSYRWSPMLWAAQGYVVALPNPRGSTGFGQKYVDEISGDWGGKCYQDLMAGLAYLEKQPYIDADRMAAAGASFGGYMMNWFAVNTGKFKTLITHCGVWNFDSMYAGTEELWFDEWEHGGPPWGKNRTSYEKHSPHRLAANLGKFKTPMLIIHNDLDFRVPVSEGLQLFTTLQRQGVPARFLNFPDEGHWVLKPRNSQRWHQEVFAWLKKHVPPGGR
jgi:dipeptidyl aminopeptidase/acylaminoacyl peptidase